MRNNFKKRWHLKKPIQKFCLYRQITPITCIPCTHKNFISFIVNKIYICINNFDCF